MFTPLMANTSSAAKQARQAERRRTLNRKTKDAVRKATKTIKTLIEDGKKEKVQSFSRNINPLSIRQPKRNVFILTPQIVKNHALQN